MSHWLELLLEFLPFPGDLQRSEQDRGRPSLWVWVGILACGALVVAFVWWRNS